jgi:Xaa-Pro aminopeptidase
MFRGAAKVADLGHRTMVEELINNGVGKSELDLIRQVEDAMRRADPMYEDSCSSSPSLICSGGAVVGTLLHNASHSKIIESGDIIHWDIAMRFEGYPVDTSRTRAIGKVSDKHHRCYEATMEIQQELFSAAKPGILASDLTNLAEKIATKNGYELWNRFIGHGLGWDVHERPDMGTEELPLEENMVLAIEPRLTCDDIYLLGNEDMTLVTNSGGVPLTEFPKEPLELS